MFLPIHFERKAFVNNRFQSDANHITLSMDCASVVHHGEDHLGRGCDNAASRRAARDGTISSHVTK
ncbi:unnamed protein product [Mycena citricolor]|uniref:Uncharacterized protein n=1 Tax=Mycena citricolor TaxID=2018698 RepID=A0AAD2K4J5_9AGAR|nr:unnamed protein product [Mycena citricolor]